MIKISTFVCFILLSAGITYGNSNGLPTNHAGNPPALVSCTQCHNSHPVNSGTGLLGLHGLPDFYYPGTTYQLFVTLQQPSQHRWGFQMTALHANNSRAGTFVPDNTGKNQALLDTSSALQFLAHTTAGTFNTIANGPVEWDFTWTAPDTSSDTIKFWLAGNAADNNSAVSGDYIYTQMYPVGPAVTPATITTLSLVPSTSFMHLQWPASPSATLYFVEESVDPYLSSSSLPHVATISLSWNDTVNMSVTTKRYYRVYGEQGTRFTTRVQAIFNKHCISCHSGPSPSGNMNLSAAFVNTVNVNASGYAGVRIAPFDTINSVLWNKINGVAAYGQRMPRGGPYLIPIDMEDIARWIAEGAINY